MDHEASKASVEKRTRRARDGAGTEVERVSRVLDTVDLIVGGATLRQVADLHGISHQMARKDWAEGLDMVADEGVDYTKRLRTEVTLRQKSLILANIPAARAGDRNAASIVIQADNLLASIWGLRNIRVEMASRPKDPGISDAMSAYLEGLADAVGNSRNGNGRHP